MNPLDDAASALFVASIFVTLRLCRCVLRQAVPCVLGSARDVGDGMVPILEPEDPPPEAGLI